MLEILNDKELVERYKNGNVACFELLMERHQNKVFSYILMLVKDRQLADDIFQDTFLKIIRKIVVSCKFKKHQNFCVTFFFFRHLNIERKFYEFPKNKGGVADVVFRGLLNTKIKIWL